ncbi:unnamed protein product [Ectocarpus sp. 4 AP-2014]
MFFEIEMERLLTAVIASIMMPYWGWDGCNFVGFALLVTATLAGSILFSLMIWWLVTKMIQQGVSSLKRRWCSGARPHGGVVAEPGDTTVRWARQRHRPERRVPSHGRAHLAERATLRARDRQRAQPQQQQQQRHLGLPCLRDQVRSPEYLAKSRKRSDQEQVERIRIGIVQAWQRDLEKKAKQEQENREREKLEQQARGRQENQQQEREKKAKQEQEKREREKLQQQERERQENQQRLRQEEADEQARRQHQDWLWEQGLQDLLQREREREEQKLQQQEQEREKKKKVQQRREAFLRRCRRWREREQVGQRIGRKMMDELHEELADSAKLQAELQASLKREREDEAAKRKLRQERRDKWEQFKQELHQEQQHRRRVLLERQQRLLHERLERDRKTQAKLQQERQQRADDHAKSQEGLQHRQQTAQQQRQQRQQPQQQRHQQHRQLQGQPSLGDSHAVRNASETPSPCPGRDSGATSETPTERRRCTTLVLTKTVKRALRMAGTEAEARRITLSAVLRTDRDVSGYSTGLPQQQIRERVGHTLDFLCSPEASGLGRKRRMGSGKKVSKTIFWAHVGTIARQRRLASADAVLGSAEKRQGCNTGGVLPAPRASSPRGQEQREALRQHGRQQRGIPQTTVEARPLPGPTRGDTLKVEHPPKSSPGGFSMGREPTRQEVESSFVKPTTGGKTVNALPFLPIPPVGPLAGRRGGAFGALTTVEARLLPGLTRGHTLKVAHPPKGSSDGFSMGKRPTTQEVQSFLKTKSGGKTVNALPFLRIAPEEPATPTAAIPAASVTAAAAAVPVPTGTEENPIHGTDSSPVTAAAAAVPVPTGTEENPIHGTDPAPVTAANPIHGTVSAYVTPAVAAVPVPTGTEENPIHGTVSAYVTPAAAAVSVTTGAEEDLTHGTVSASVAAAAASAVPLTTTGIEEVSHDGAGVSSTHQASVACTVMSIPDLPEYEEQRAAHEAQIRRNRPSTKTDTPLPDTTVGNTRSTSTAAPVTPNTEQPFERVKQGKWRVLTADYLSTDSEDGSGEEDGWG